MEAGTSASNIDDSRSTMLIFPPIFFFKTEYPFFFNRARTYVRWSGGGGGEGKIASQ